MSAEKGVVTHIKQVLGHLAIFVLLFEVDVTQRVNNEDFSVLSNDPLLCASRPTALGLGLGSRRSRDGGGCPLVARATSLAPSSVLPSVLLGIALLHSAHLAVHRHGPSFVILVHLLGRLRGRGRSSRGLRVDARNVDAEVLAPSGMARKLDVPLDKLALALPAHVEGKVVRCAAGDEEDAEDGGAQARAVAVVVVFGALPRGEAVREEVVIAVATRPAQDVGDDGQAGLTAFGALDGGLDLGGGGRLRRRGARLALLFLGLLLLGLEALSGELLPDFVGMEQPRPLLVGLVDVIDACRSLHAQEVIEGDIVSLMCNEFVTNTEDLAVY